MPSNSPSKDPTHDPMSDPTFDPTPNPSNDPTSDPTVDPSLDPTIDPTIYPTTNPSINPTKNPTIGTTTVICDGINQNCSSGYTCPANGDCRITCMNTNCQNALLTCPLNGDCSIKCLSLTDYGCQYLSIDASSQIGNFEFYVSDPNGRTDYLAQYVDIQGSMVTSGQTGTLFNVTCGRGSSELNTCVYANIRCAKGMDCKIDCSAGSWSCWSAGIVGPSDYPLAIECGRSGCGSQNVMAQNSSLLQLNCDKGGCCGIDIYCPVNTNQNNMCQLTGISILYHYSLTVLISTRMYRISYS